MGVMPKLAQKSGDLADGLFGFQEAVNFVSFFRLRCSYILQLELGGLSGYVSVTFSATRHRVHLYCTTWLNPSFD